MASFFFFTQHPIERIRTICPPLYESRAKEPVPSIFDPLYTSPIDHNHNHGDHHLAPECRRLPIWNPCQSNPTDFLSRPPRATKNSLSAAPTSPAKRVEKRERATKRGKSRSPFKQAVEAPWAAREVSKREGKKRKERRGRDNYVNGIERRNEKIK